MLYLQRLPQTLCRVLRNDWLSHGNQLPMYRNGLGFRAIERVTGVNHHTVILWVKKAAAQLPVDPAAASMAESTQGDEVQTFVGQKE